MKRRWIAVLFAVVMLTITACGENVGKPPESESISTEQKQEKETQAEESTESIGGKIGEVQESPDGKRIKIKEKKNISLVQESGPFSMKLNEVRVYNLEPSEEFKEFYGGKDRVTVVAISVETENKSEETNWIDPGQGTLVTNTKEQKEANIFLGEETGGEFIGNIIKTGSVVFVLDSKAEDIQSIKYVVDAPYNKNLEDIGEAMTFEVNLD